MADQWYLDLDGIKSGPYHSHEILGLLAEGEILPHHRISAQLTESSWTSLLEWRLQQANLINKKFDDPNSPNETTSSQNAEEKKEPWPFQQIQTPIQAPTPPPIEIAPPAHPPLTVAQPPAQAPHSDVPLVSKKRDPVAEMFEMLQNTKHKREAKSMIDAQNQNLVQSAQLSPPSPYSSKRFVGTLAIITLIGFIFGQWMQKSDVKTDQASATPTPTATPDYQERTVGKVIVRTPIAKDTPAEVPQPKPIKKSNPPASIANPEDSQNAAEMMELKKELQELKNLREEIKKGMNKDDNISVPILPPDPSYDSSLDPNDELAPEPDGSPSYPSPLSDPSLHY